MGTQLVSDINPKMMSKVVSVGGLVHCLFYSSQLLHRQNLGKLKTWVSGGEGGMEENRGCGCLWVLTVLQMQCVTHWHQGGLNALLIPLSARGRSCFCQHTEVSVELLAFSRGYGYIIKGKIPEKVNEFQGYEQGRP